MRPALVAEDDPTLLLRTMRGKWPGLCARNDGLGPRMRPVPVPEGDRTLTGTTGQRKRPPGGPPRLGEGRQRRGGTLGGAARAGWGWLALAPFYPPSLSGRFPG